MEQESGFSGREIVGVAAAAAAALGGIVVALGRAQQGASHARQLAAEHAHRDDAAQLAQRAREAARTATSQLTERYPEVRESAAHVAHRAAELATPNVSRLSDIAGEQAARLREAGIHTLERLQETAVPAVTEAVSGIAHRASAVMPESPPEPAVVQVAAERAGAVAKSAGSGAREMLAAVIWLVAAGAVIYGLLLSEERRQRLVEAISGAIEQAQLLISDFAGYEDDF